MLLDWTQLGYWRFNIELGTVEAIPLMVHNCEQFSQVVELSTLSQSRTCTLCIVMFSQLERSCHYSSGRTCYRREREADWLERRPLDQGGEP